MPEPPRPPMQRDPIGELIAPTGAIVRRDWPGMHDPMISLPAKLLMYDTVRKEDNIQKMIDAAPLYGVNPQDTVLENGKQFATLQIETAAKKRAEALAALYALATIPRAYSNEPDGLDRWLEDYSSRSSYSPSLTKDDVTSAINGGIEFYDRIGESNVSTAMRATLATMQYGNTPESTGKAAAQAFWTARVGSRVGDESIELGKSVEWLKTHATSSDSAANSWKQTHDFYNNPLFEEVRLLLDPEVLSAVAKDIHYSRRELAEQLDTISRGVSMIMDDDPRTLSTYYQFRRWQVEMGNAVENMNVEIAIANGMPSTWDTMLHKLPGEIKKSATWLPPFGVPTALGKSFEQSSGVFHNIPPWALRDEIQGWRKVSQYPMEVAMMAPYGVLDMLTPAIAGSGIVGQSDWEEQERLAKRVDKTNPLGLVRSFAKGEKYALAPGSYAGTKRGTFTPELGRALEKYLSLDVGKRMAQDPEQYAGWLEFGGQLAMYPVLHKISPPAATALGTTQVATMGPDDWAMMYPIMKGGRLITGKPSAIPKLTNDLRYLAGKGVEYGAFPAAATLGHEDPEQPAEQPPPPKKSSIPPAMKAK